MEECQAECVEVYLVFESQLLILFEYTEDSEVDSSPDRLPSIKIHE